MIDILNKYLIQHKNINIPGLGTLYLEHIPARADLVNNQILPPRYGLRFDKYFDAPDKAFFTYLASQTKLPDYEAIKLYNQFAQDIRSKIKTEEKALWKEIGVFSKDSSGEIVFEPVYDLLQPFAPVRAERIDHPDTVVVQEAGDDITADVLVPEMADEEVTGQVLHKDHWWVYALVLGAIGLAVLMLQLYRYGFTWESIANHQPLH